MKIICLADTHGLLNEIDIPPGDVLIIAGDVTMMGTIPQITAFNKDLGYLSHEHKLFCWGNHDWLGARQPSLAKSLITNGTLLQDEEIIIDGIKFYFSPASPTFMNWAFNFNRGKDIRRVWDKIPSKVDVLVTHGPPMGILDTVNRDLGIRWENDERKDFGYKIEHVGCKDLLNKIKEIKPKYHCFGHIHKHGGKQITKRETTFINASICNERYEPVNKPIVIEV